MAAPFQSPEKKSERLEMRVTPSAKTLIQRATALSGLSAADLAFEAAIRVIETHETIVLSGKDAEVVATTLADPPHPSDELVAAVKRSKGILRQA